MTLQQLTYLVTVAECGNITDAAERLFLSAAEFELPRFTI